MNITMEEYIKEIYGIENVSKLNISDELKNELTKEICSTKEAQYIYDFATKVKELTTTNKDDLTSSICETEEIEVMCDFMKDVPNLSQENIGNLIESIFKEEFIGISEIPSEYKCKKKTTLRQRISNCFSHNKNGH